LFLGFLDRVLPLILHIAQAGPRTHHPSASACWMLGLHTCTIMPSWVFVAVAVF
jgi:hypothetical protein